MADEGSNDGAARVSDGSADSSKEDQRAWWKTIPNEIFKEHSQIYDKVIAARQNSLDAAVLSALRADVIEATHWTAKRDSIIEYSRRLNEWMLSYAFVVPASIALILISPTPGWMKSLVTLACVLFLVPDDNSSRDVITVFALPVVAIVVLVTPFDGLRILWRFLAVLFVLLACIVISWINQTVIVKFFSYKALVVLALLDSAVLFVSTAGFDGLAGGFEWLLVVFALRFGLAGAAVLGLFLVTIEVVNQAGWRFVDMRKLREIPEAEFVQSTIWALSDLDAKLPLEWADLPEQRRVMVWRLEWLVRVLEIDIPRKLAKLDASNAAYIQSLFRGKAAVLHCWMQNLLLGDKGTGISVINDIWEMGVIGASRRWSLLPEMTVNAPSKERLIRRIWGMAKRLLVLLVPAAISVVLWITEQKEAAVTAAIITAVVLVDILSPGSGGRLADAAGQASGLPHGRGKG